MFDRGSPLLEIARRQKGRHKLIAALANLRANSGEVEVEPECRKSALPRLCVEIDTIHESAVDVENYRIGVDQARLSHVMIEHPDLHS
jgi:hypothetical protein